jgi:heme-degrading monooxygenase HmoA
VVTRWRDQEAFDAWVSSAAFGHGHRPAGTDGDAAAGPAPADGAARPSVSVHAELWSYDIVLGSEGNRPG